MKIVVVTSPIGFFALNSENAIIEYVLLPKRFEAIAEVLQALQDGSLPTEMTQLILPTRAERAARPVQKSPARALGGRAILSALENP